MNINKVAFLVLIIILSSCSNNRKARNLKALINNNIYSRIKLDTVFIAKFDNKKLKMFLSENQFICKKLIQNDSITEIQLYQWETEISTNDHEKLKIILLNNEIFPLINLEQNKFKKNMELRSGGGCILTFKENKLFDFVFLQ